ncbi:AcrR family transcriptional regulator [Paenibacillus phyllosphaerae]|uniref:AcrR family transcriptional regulator n=1 Tax=Paenibacillus phyllosphaerae TaxID=274593 RepID=A0A7W5FMU5_9BACL|nr:TetR/AcrR family transcriptional regulator [Paenibacillus phyllosphaerae]MBB3110621.1 AcrR family transcriptional regulator [Paenibacillus phyllosphaerae]
MTASKLKQAAMVLFTESGYEGTSLSEIAKAVGIKTPSIYAHFESKEQLFMSVLEDVLAEERLRFGAMMEKTEGQPPIERVRAAFDHFSAPDTTTGHTFLKRAIMVPPRHLRDRLRADFAAFELFLNAGMEQLFRNCSTRGKDQVPEVERLIVLFYGLVDGLLVEHEAYEEQVFEVRRRMLWEWFERALQETEGTAAK